MMNYEGYETVTCAECEKVIMQCLRDEITRLIVCADCLDKPLVEEVETMPAIDPRTQETIWRMEELRDIADLIERGVCVVDEFRVSIDAPDRPGFERTELHVVIRQYKNPFVEEPENHARD